MAVRRLFVSFLVAALMAGCQFGETQRPPCECPNSEAIVSSIDWFGDRAVPSELDSAGGEEGPEVGVLFDQFEDLDDARAGLEHLYAELVGAGLMSGTPSVDDPIGVEVELEDASVTILPPLAEASSATEIAIDVALFVPDERAAAALEPLVAALGIAG